MDIIQLVDEMCQDLLNLIELLEKNLEEKANEYLKTMDSKKLLCLLGFVVIINSYLGEQEKCKKTTE